jgi:hypothetical protein
MRLHHSCIRVTAETDVDLDQFALDDIIDYLRDEGYHVSKATDADDSLRFPQGVFTYDEYVRRYCVLNRIELK